MGGQPRRPPTGPSKTDLRRGRLSPARIAPQPAPAARPPTPASNAEQAFLFDEEERPSPRTTR